MGSHVIIINTTTTCEKMADGDKNDLQTIADDLVVTKYKMAAEIVNKVLKEFSEKCVPEASVRDLCIMGDTRLAEETGKASKKDKKLQKGLAFPTCISVNNCICHYSPLFSEPDTILADGDMVKIDMGAHIDGFIAVVAHTLVVGASADKPVSGKAADVVMAAHLASEAALRLVKPGNETYSVTDTVQKIAEDFDCKPVEGMLSHQLEQNRIDGEKTAKITIYKKTDETYMLKMKTSREFFSKVSKQFAGMPFNLRNCDDEKKARMGVVECVTHKLIEPFQVLYDKEGESVAQFKFTVLLMPNGPHKITGLPFEADLYKTEKSIEDLDLQKLLKTSANPKAAKKKKKAAEKAVNEETAAPALVAAES